jgi:hypothetical protein
MRRFTDAGRAALGADNLYAALSLALTLPDICGSLEDPGEGKSRLRYVRWCKQWLQPVYTSNIMGKEVVFLTAEQCYKLRNSLIHSGSSDVRTDGLQHIAFVAWENMHRIKTNEVMLLSTAIFSRDVYAAVDAWDAATAANRQVQIEKDRLLKIHTEGFEIGAMRVGVGPPLK